MINSVKKFISYWYFRYLLVTELYMVERWERVVIHIVFLIIFSLLSLFNTSVVLPFIDYTRRCISQSTFLEDFNSLMDEAKKSMHSEM